MADTIADIQVSGDDWSDVNTLTSIAAGTEIQITNNSVPELGSGYVRIAIAASKPSATLKNFGKRLTPLSKPGHTLNIAAGNNKVWAKCEAEGQSAFLNVEVV